MDVPFRIKICGVTNSDDALAAVEAGADAIGLNFFAGSKRCVAIEQAAQIAAAVRRPGVCLAGVFVNAAADEILRTVHKVGLNAVQLHGDETPEFVLALDDALQATLFEHGRPFIIRAFRCREGNLEAEEKFLLACDRPYAPLVPQVVLLDAYQPNAYGGTGAIIDWNLVREQRDRAGGRTIVLAGGLTANNIAAAIHAARPDAVDVASGVESSPRKRDHDLVRAFVTNARCAFSN